MEKWKTFPCKECLVKRTCLECCFKIPTTIKLRRRRNHLKNKCYGCGEKISSGWNSCIICTSNIRLRRLGIHGRYY